jgi:UDP-glucose-4-epimerase GalE
MRKILVTGGAGYIGSHVVKLLRDETDAHIHVVDNFSQTRANILNHPRITYHEVDIRNKSELQKIFQSQTFDAVMHFAALASVPDSVINPASYYENNVVGTFNLLEAMRETGVSRIIFSSSAAVYGEPLTEEIDESHPTNPKNPYGMTKLMGEHMLKDYFVAYRISSVSFRYFCAAGADEDREVGEYHTPETHAIPVLIQTALGQRDFFSVYGADYPTPDGSGVRDYIHVKDLARAHILALNLLLQQEGICERFNLGINKGFSVLELIQTFEELSGTKIPYRVAERRPGDPARLIARADRAMGALSWKPTYTDLPDIITSAYESFKRRV